MFVIMNPGEFPAWIYYVVLLWTQAWTGVTLWRAARLHQRNWFIFFLIIHTAGLLEAIYLFYFAKKRLTIEEVKSWFRNMFYSKPK